MFIDLTGKGSVYTKAEIDAMLATLETPSYEVVSELPVTGDGNIIYLLPVQSGDSYEQWIYTENDGWVKIGETAIELDDYVTDLELGTILEDYATISSVNSGLAAKQDTLTAGDRINISTQNVISADSQILSLTQQEYDALGTNIDPDMVYVITDASPVVLATVATTGSYNDLTDTPTLATVATSGSYNDLSNTPIIPTVGTGVVTLTQGGATIGTINVNDTADKTIDIPAGSDGKPYVELNGMSQQELADLYTEIIEDTEAYTMANAVYCNGQPVNYCFIGYYTVDNDGMLVYDDTLEDYTVGFELETTANIDGDNTTWTMYYLLFSDGTLNSASTVVEGGTAVSGTNDGTNWTSLTIGTDTYDIPQGGSSGNAWYGSQYQFDTLGTYDADTDYYISEIQYSEIKGTPNLSVYETKAASQAADQALDVKIAGKMDPIVFVGTGGIASIGTPLEGVTYAIEGETLPLTFTLADQSTVTYNFVID